MRWKDVFYVTDVRNVYYWDKSFQHRDENDVYNVHIRPNNYYPDAEHFAMNSCTSWDNCMWLITKMVVQYETPENFFDHCIDNMYVFHVESKYEYKRLQDHYKNYIEVIEEWDEYIADAIANAKNYKYIAGKNISVIIGDINRPEGRRKLTAIKGTYAWIDWSKNYLIKNIVEFEGHTKKELFYLLSYEFDVSLFNYMLAELKRHGVYSIAHLKDLDEVDLYYYLTDFINYLEEF